MCRRSCTLEDTLGNTAQARAGANKQLGRVKLTFNRSADPGDKDRSLELPLRLTGIPLPPVFGERGSAIRPLNGLLNGLSEEKCWDCEQLQRSVCMQARVHARCVRDSACAAQRRVPVYVCVRQQGLVQRMYMHMNHTKRCVARLSAPGHRLVRPIQKVVLQP